MIDDDTLKNIENLHRLKTEGVITEEDFEKAKNDLLNGNRREARPASFLTSTTEPVELPSDQDHFGWMTLALRRYFDFNGRSTRKEFWMFLLLANAVTLGLGIIALLDTGPLGLTGPVGDLMFGLIGLVVLGAIVPLIAAEVRRFHDQDKSGWATLLNLIPYIGPLIVFAMMAIDGTWGENRYGPDPLQRD